MDDFDKLLVLPYQPSESHNYTHFIGILLLLLLLLILTIILIDVGDDELFQNEKFLNVLLKRNSHNDNNKSEYYY